MGTYRTVSRILLGVAGWLFVIWATAVAFRFVMPVNGTPHLQNETTHLVSKADLIKTETKLLEAIWKEK